MQLPTSAVLCQHVEALVSLICFHQMHDEGMVILSEHLDLSLDNFQGRAVHLLHALQGVLEACLLMLHKLHHSRGATAYNFQTLQVVHFDTMVCKRHTVHQKLSGGCLFLDYFFKSTLVNRPDLRLWTCYLDCCCTRLVKQQRPFSKVCILHHCTDNQIINFGMHLTTDDNEKMRAFLACYNHFFTLRKGLPRSTAHEQLDLVVG
mmetsp:Transcript_77075/g.140091  ORF Transcript_77075/g.140091 Transcript_77075/m.140091 type:complete len:205 (-) Transcript_77075:1024-1638(-)